MVAGFQKTNDGNVQGLRGILRQDDPQRVVNALESGQSLTGVEDDAACIDGQAVSRTPGAAAHFPQA
jgi:hypothetical protein